MEAYRMIPMRRCPTCGAIIFLNPMTDETKTECICETPPEVIVKSNRYASGGSTSD